MDALKITGRKTLSGVISVSGSKNATLPIVTAALLSDGTSILRNAPELADVQTLCRVIEHAGAMTSRYDDELRIDGSRVDRPEAPYDWVRRMRASFLVLGPLLARFGHARVSLPGGCAIGARPVDQHLKAFKKMGAAIELDAGYVVASAPQGLQGAEIDFDMPTVGGTENVMLAASLARGTTIIRNAAREPEIADLAKALRSMGAKITGDGMSEIVIEGSSSLAPFDHRVMADRIEAGTYAVAGALVGHDLTVQGFEIASQQALIDVLEALGAQYRLGDGCLTLSKIEHGHPVEVVTGPFPEFPTDMQAQLMALMTQIEGVSSITETIFENRFMHVAELSRLGAEIAINGPVASVFGPRRLSGTAVMATDLRASASLVLAALAAEGETIIRRIYHLDRGYTDLEKKLQAVGACVERVEG